MTQRKKPNQTLVQHFLPGDPEPKVQVERMIRVNHAGEYGAVRIYEGQLAVLKGTPSEEPIREMARQEERHLEGFNKLIAERNNVKFKFNSSCVAVSALGTLQMQKQSLLLCTWTNIGYRRAMFDV